MKCGAGPASASESVSFIYSGQEILYFPAINQTKEGCDIQQVCIVLIRKKDTNISSNVGMFSLRKDMS